MRIKSVPAIAEPAITPVCCFDVTSGAELRLVGKAVMI